MEVTHENYKMYQEFLEVKRRKSLEKHRLLWDLGLLFVSITLYVGGFIGGTFIIKHLNEVVVHGLMDIIGTCFFGTYSLGMGFLLAKGLPRLVDHILIHNFKRKYPEFDIKTDSYEVEESLEKYNQFPKISEDIEQKKEEHLSCYQDEFSQMTTEEKLQVLNQERFFWEQVAIQEQYQSIGLEIPEQDCSSKEHLSKEKHI